MCGFILDPGCESAYSSGSARTGLRVVRVCGCRVGLAGNAATLSPGSVYQHRKQLFDIRAGENAFVNPPKLVCGDDYLCVAKRGYDAPTGLGTPAGIGAF
jgi:hypothetical protein